MAKLCYRRRLSAFRLRGKAFQFWRIQSNGLSLGMNLPSPPYSGFFLRVSFQLPHPNGPVLSLPKVRFDSQSRNKAARVGIQMEQKFTQFSEQKHTMQILDQPGLRCLAISQTLSARSQNSCLGSLTNRTIQPLISLR